MVQPDPRPADYLDWMLPPLPELPLVSVFALAYNHEAFVAEAVESVLAQDWPADRLEFVILDDGSTDGTADAIAPYRSRAQVLQQPNQGLRASLNRIMSLMTGDVIVGVAGDDVWLPGRIDRLVRALRENPNAGLAYSDGELIDASGAVLHPSFVAWANITPRNGRIRGPLLARNFVSGGACMLRGCLKEAFHPAPAYAPWEDYWWAWAVSGVADVVHVPERTYRYRYHGGNLSLGAAGERFSAVVAQELPFRRQMLTEVRPDEATAAELVQGIVSLWSLIGHLPVEEGPTLAPDDDARGAAGERLSEVGAALADGDYDAAALACARVAALHPLDPALPPLVEAIADRLAGQPVGIAPSHRPLAAELGARSFLVLVDGEQLLRTPQLLAAYADRFGGHDDATLVIHAAAHALERVSTEVPPLLGSIGIDADGGPDMVLACESPARLRTLVTEADAVIGTDIFDSGLPAFGAQDVPSLHVLARQRWSARTG